MTRRWTLEIGSGHNPTAEADVLLDRHLEDDGERGGPLILDGRPFVVGDAQRLPFRDQAFDRVIARHVVEHVEDPGQTLREMMRVGRRGYIETPTEFSERLEPHRDYHRWMVRASEGELLLVPRGAAQRGGLEGVFHRLWRDNFTYRMFFRLNPDVFFVRYHWRGTIRWRILPRFEEPVEAHLPLSESKSRAMAKFVRRVGGKLAHMSRRIRKPVRRRCDVWSLLACPSCRGDVRREGDHVRCLHCSLRYPIRQGIPIMLVDEVVPPIGVSAPKAQADVAPPLLSVSSRKTTQR